ncbi:DUF3010 family protein [Tumebacillus permanentifrigoris]|uniref:DUF3010 family protein n=1 Tax=Tumebacillus permanentifrigoris TaxID=378543 RepID=A0A316DC65_9BACL|nr:DUF3010 family protein [Tumebacillus permanentifrigoris]PWK14496.1 hypothetical protein C7459_105263 [Tumebacillus permanentifrigoris]
MSTVCGIEIKGSQAIVVTLQGTKSNYELINTKVKKIELEDPKAQRAVQTFQQAITSYFKEHAISTVGIKERATKGDFSGGPISFKIEGIIQTLDLPSSLVHATTLSATVRRHEVDVESVNINKYQRDAFKVAFHLLED